MTLEYLKYNDIPVDWRPPEWKYINFIESVGKYITEECKYWCSEEDQSKELKSKCKDRTRKDRMSVKCGRKQIRTLSYVWFSGTYCCYYF